MESSSNRLHISTQRRRNGFKSEGALYPALGDGKNFLKCPVTFSLCPSCRVGTDGHVPSWFTVSVDHRYSSFMVYAVVITGYNNVVFLN